MPKLVYVDQVLALDGSEVVLGRHRECTLQVDDEKASRRHARLFVEQGEWWIEDLESANGTTLNGKPLIGRRKLSHEDGIGIGKSRLQFLDADSAPAAPVREKRSSAAQGFAGNPELLLGRTLGGYELTTVLGKSHLGATYRARHPASGREAALKVFTADASGRGDFATRLLEAVRKAGAVKHQYLMQLLECGLDQELGSLWYSMELVEGESLAALLERDGTMAPGIAGLVVERTALALQALHAAGLVHRDVYPRNVLLTPAGQVKVGEPALAEAMAVGRGSAGDPAYRAPEGPIDARSDVYSLGCLFYTLLSGQPPFAGDTPEALAKAHAEAPIPNLRDRMAKLPEKLDHLVHGMLAKNPEWRHASVEEVLAELTPLRAELQMDGVAVRREPQAEHAHGGTRMAGARRHRGNGVTSLIVWMLIIGTAAAVVWQLPAWKKAQPDVESQTVTGKPGVADPPPVVYRPVVVIPAGDPHAEGWRTIQNQLETDAARGDWGAAERALGRFAATEGLSPAILKDVRLARNRLQIEGEAWYQAEIAKLPPDLTIALARLGLLRDVAITSERGDAEARYQEVQTRLLQRLNVAKRAARLAVEGGKSADLPSLGDALEPSFRGTPIAGLQRQFAIACSEAAPAARFWKGGWPATREVLVKTSGVDALSAAAALLLAGEVAAAKRLLLGDPALQAGALLRRREALLGREAAVLAFTDPGDLQYIETGIGDVRFADGVLTGAIGETVGLRCTVPVGGSDWEALVVLHLDNAPDGQAQATIAAIVGETHEVSVKITGDGLLAKVHSGEGWEQQFSARPETAPLKLRLVCRGSTLQVIVADQSILEVKGAQVPEGARLAIDVSGADWKLDELQVVGGG